MDTWHLGPQGNRYYVALESQVGAYAPLGSDPCRLAGLDAPSTWAVVALLARVAQSAGPIARVAPKDAHTTGSGYTGEPFAHRSGPTSTTKGTPNGQ